MNFWGGKWICRAPECKEQFGNLASLLEHQRKDHPGKKLLGTTYLEKDEMRAA
jgi:hypothetical protein